MLEIKLDVIASNIRGHGDDRRAVKLTDKMACRYTVQIRHDDIHQNEIVFGTTLDFIHSLQAVKLLGKLATLLVNMKLLITYRGINDTRERVQEFAADLPTGSIVLNQENLWAAHPARVNIGAFLPVVRKLSTSL